MRILIIAQWFDPEPNIKGLCMALELQRLGHQVEILTGFPNYPGGKIYPGYRLKLFDREQRLGININRVWLYPSHSNSRLGRVANYISFLTSIILLGPFLVSKPDVVYIYHPPMTVGVAGSILSRLFRVPFIIDIQDLWPDSLSATGMISSKKILTLTGYVCNAVYRLADRILTISPGVKKLLAARGVPPDKLEVMYNWADERQLVVPDVASAALMEKHKLTNRFNIVFAGNIGAAQSLDCVLECARLLKSQNPTVQFVFIGQGIDRQRLIDKARSQDLTNVIFIDQQPMSKIGEFLAAADVLLIHLKHDDLFAITIPSKTQAYMWAGKPILIGVPGDASDLVKESGAGFVFDPEDATSLKEAVLKMLNLTEEQRKALGTAGQQYYQSRLSMTAGVARLVEILESMRAGKSEKGNFARRAA